MNTRPVADRHGASAVDNRPGDGAHGEHMMNRRTRAIRRLVALVGRVKSADYVVTEPAIAGFCRVWAKLTEQRGTRALWLRMRGRSAFAFAEPRSWRQERERLTAGDVEQLTEEFLRG